MLEKRLANPNERFVFICDFRSFLCLKMLLQNWGNKLNNGLNNYQSFLYNLHIFKRNSFFFF
jgi:hypothetical protein